MVAQVFIFCVSIVILGWLWFFIVRPILEAYGGVRPMESVKDHKSVTPAPILIMSREEVAPLPSLPSPLETDGRRTETTAPQAKFTEDQLLTLYAGLRAHGMVRDKASQILKGAGIPMNNNLWAKAATPPPSTAPAEDDDVLVTPFAGRRTRASFYPDSPDLEYNDPPP